MAEEIKIPEGYILVEDPAIVAERQRQEQIKQLEEQIAGTPVPSDEELIAIGKIYHPYYELLIQLEVLKNN